MSVEDLHRRALSARDRGQPGECGVLCEQALELAASRGDLSGALRVGRTGWYAWKKAGDIDRASGLLDRSCLLLQQAEAADAATLRVGMEIFVLWASRQINTSGITYDALLERMADFEALLEAGGVAHRGDGLHYLRAFICDHRDNLKGALSEIEQAVALKSEHTDETWAYGLETYQRARVGWLRRLGQLEEAEAVIRELLASEQRRRVRVELLGLLARTVLSAGDPDSARRLIGEALAEADQRGLDIEQHCLGAAVDIYRAVGMLDEARRCAERYLMLVEGSQRQAFYICPALEDVINTALDQGDLAAARRYLARGLPLAREEDRRCGSTEQVATFEALQERLDALEQG